MKTKLGKSGRPRERRERLWCERSHAGGMDEWNESRAQCALLDDPRERTLAKLIGRELECRARIAFHPHRFDRCDTLRWKCLPCTECPQERCAAGADRIDAVVPVIAAGGKRRC